MLHNKIVLDDFSNCNIKSFTVIDITQQDLKLYLLEFIYRAIDTTVAHLTIK